MKFFACSLLLLVIAVAARADNFSPTEFGSCSWMAPNSR
jgi:hypothetical protein